MGEHNEHQYRGRQRHHWIVGWACALYRERYTSTTTDKGSKVDMRRVVSNTTIGQHNVHKNRGRQRHHVIVGWTYALLRIAYMGLTLMFIYRASVS